MNCYELIYALPGDANQEVMNDFNNDIKSKITEKGGKVEEIDFWGLKKFAYPVNKKLEGNYYFLKFFLEPKFLLELQNNFRISDLVLRYNFMKIEKDFSIRKKKNRKINLEDKSKEEINN